MKSKPIVIGRTATFFGRILLNDGHGNGVLLTDTDKMMFSVREKPDDEYSPIIIQKTITSNDEFEGGYGFELTPEETNLPTGTYYYGIGVQRKNGEFYHIIKKEPFIIEPSVLK